MRQTEKNILKGLAWGVLICGILTLLLGCKTAKTATTSNNHFCDSTKMMIRDSAENKYVRDSLFFHDSVFVYVSAKNDTTIKETYRFRYVYRDRTLTDTVAVERKDTVIKTVVQERKVTEYKYQTRWYDRICRSVTLAVAFLLIYALLRYLRSRDK